MNPIRHLRRVAAALAGLTAALLAFAAAAPAAFASGQPPPRPPGWNKHPPVSPGHIVGPVYQVRVHTVVIGGMPGWQIAVIAAGAALLAAIAAVAVYRAWAARRKPVTVAA